MDTNTLSDIFNDLLNDSRFMIVTGVPSIKTDADSKEFLRKYIEYCRQIEINRLEKIRDMLEGLGWDARNCAQAIAQRIKEMTEACQADLSDDEKAILCHDSNTNGYADVPNYETVRKWLSRSGTREPKRWSLYQIAFALGLRACFPKDIDDPTLENYKGTVNYLFNKVYNQRFVTRTAHELIFIFCLLHGKSYTEALKMYCQYKTGCEKEIPKAPQMLVPSQNNSTLFFVAKGIANDEQGFIRDLIVVSPLLEDEHSSVFDRLEEWRQYFEQDETTEDFKNYPKGNLTVGESVFISKALKKNLQLLDRRMRITSALHEHSTDADNEKRLIAVFENLGVSKELYQILKDYGDYSISAVFGEGSQPFFSEIISDVMLTAEEIFAKRIENENGVSEWRMDIYRELSHNLIYRDLRKAVIVTHFFRYWSSTDRDDEPDYDDYVGEINEILTDLFYLPLYLKNSYDCFFMLCAKTKDPIGTYYAVFREIFNIYKQYNYEFISSDDFPSLAYCELQASELIYDYDALIPLDQSAVQKEMLQAIQEISRVQK